MCIRDRVYALDRRNGRFFGCRAGHPVDDGICTFGEDGGSLCGGDLGICLLYTSDAADERSSVDLGGRRIIKKKTRSRI